MRAADAHLTPQEFELVLFTGAVSTPTTADRAQVREAQQHLDGCEHCQSVAKQYANVDSALGRLRAGQGSSRKADCPAEAVWLELAAGLSDERSVSGLMEHAAQCDYCGKLLREAAEDIAMEPSPEIGRAVAGLRTAQPDAQQALTARLAKTGTGRDEPVSDRGRESAVRPEGRPRFTGWPRLVWAAAGLAVLVVAALVGMRMLRQPDPNELLAKAYTEKRTIELRFPGAEYGPIRVERGAENKDQPTEFYEAEVIIKRESGKHAEDPNWLQAQARAALLQWEYESAIRDIEDALMLKPDDPALLQDKAMAYFERAEKLGPQGAIDYGEAAEDLSKTLKKTPDDPVALFNRAIIYEKIHLPNEAIADLEHYLRIDPSGPWSAEAKERLDRLKKMVKAHDDALAEPLDDPATFLRHMGDPAAVAHIDERIEDYQDLAIKEWLPAAFPVTGRTSKSGEAFSALRALADILQERHKDKWLNDLLDSSSNTPGFALAVAKLSEELPLSDGGDSVRAYSAAISGANLFLQASSPAGVLRAQSEAVHALQRSHRFAECVRLADTTQSTLKTSAVSYPWISAQVAIDQAACSLTVAEFDYGRSQISKALEQAFEGGFPVLRQRTVGIAAAGSAFAGDTASAWSANEEGLAEFWQTSASPSVRAHQFYDELAYASDSLERPHLALSFAEESVATLSQQQSKKSVEILVRQHAAKLAAKTGELALAGEELNKAQHLINSSPQSKLQLAFRLDSDITLAEIDLQQGQLDQAQRTLNDAEALAPSVRMLAVTLEFYGARAELLRVENRNEQAEEELIRGVSNIESSLRGLRTGSERESWSHENSEFFRHLVSAEIANGQDEKAFYTWEWYRAAGIQAEKLKGSLDEFLDHNGSHAFLSRLVDQTVISYALVPRGLVIWTADDRGIKMHFTNLDPRDFVQLASGFVEMCANRTSDLGLLRRRAHTLFAILISPIIGELIPGRSVVIEPDDLIGDIPFQALMTPTGHYLVEEYSLVLSPGILYAERLRSPVALGRAAHVLVVGSPANAMGDEIVLQPIDVEPETNEVASIFTHSVLLTGNAATAERIASALPNSQIFHFVGHNLSGVTRDGLLVFATRKGSVTSSLWGGRDLDQRLFSMCHLVVLSACSTGKAATNRRETHGGTIRAILGSGVTNVVATQWDVDSESTRLLIRSFYKALFSGKSAAASVRAAELDLLGHAETAHPYYWAAFAAFGHA